VKPEAGYGPFSNMVQGSMCHYEAQGWLWSLQHCAELVQIKVAPFLWTRVIANLWTYNMKHINIVLIVAI